MYVVTHYTTNAESAIQQELHPSNLIVEFLGNAPVLRETFTEKTLEPGPSLSLKCIAAGSPLPQITWSLDDSPLPESLRVRFGDYVTKESVVISYVNISDVRVEDGGEYKCRADNGISLVEHSARINVVGPPVVRTMRNITVVAGEVLVVRCPVAGYPIDSIAWERAGLRLPYNHRQKVHDNGVLEVHQVERSTDEGPYVCIASNNKGQQAQTTVHINVKIKPVIEDFFFPKSLREGQRASALCTVSSGDLPILIQWFKDNIPLSNHKGILVNVVADYSSTLLFESLTLDHKGNYTCIATNDAGTVSHTASMIIHVPPRWVIEPMDTAVVRGRSVSVDCQAEGYQVPRIRWTKAEGNSPRNFKPIVSSPHLQVYENGSLTIHDARDTDAGYYLCQATNGIGSGLSKVVKITVHVAAHFKSKFIAEMVSKGQDVSLKCEATGDVPITITWTKDKQKFSTQTTLPGSFVVGVGYGSHTSDNRYQITETVEQKGVISEIQIKKADRRDSALFTCFAANAYGYDDTNIQLIVQEPPDAPQDLQIVEITSRSVKLAWSPPYSGNSPITSYYIQYRSVLDTSKKVNHVTVPSGESFGQVTGLKPATMYIFSLIAENRIGRSESGRSVEAICDEEAPGGPPLKVQLQAINSKAIKVTWKAPNKDLQYGVIKGYYIGYKPVATSESFIYKTLDVQEKFKEETIITGLKRHSKYAVIVQAFNNKGAGPSSEESTVETLEMNPPQTPQLHVTSTSTSSIHLNWEPILDESNAIDGYLLYQRKESASEWREIRLQGQQTSYVGLNLNCGTRYQFHLVAFNKIGRGEQSDTITVKTDGSVPVAPDRQSVVSVNTSTATIHLDAWHHGGCVINSFKVRYRLQGAKSDWTEIHNINEDRQLELQGLQPAKKYNLQITAYNEVGFTEAEYSFSTLSQIPDELGVRSSTKY
ncbi:Down syndrome cell adhesion molecule-like protein Dscam2, partial [Leptotrombidium deliense]